eukprot:CAMPEP_0170545288 /NCGR_PEP_ID=MMETSP0211-20121228/3729_1 /TAXON_ID=311385 /ORGANISM="Pseudokeronopsis sp., Strain OXSARD2" /LENGTH=37 /DNA_ID= /DNA_START= /DNA_END= /DNA_ORIENTATION=
MSIQDFEKRKDQFEKDGMLFHLKMIGIEPDVALYALK